MEATHPAVRVGAAAGGRLMHSRFYRLRGLRRSPAALAAGADEDDPRLGALQFRLRELTAHDPGAAAPALPARAIVDPQITVASQHPAGEIGRARVGKEWRWRRWCGGSNRKARAA